MRQGRVQLPISFQLTCRAATRIKGIRYLTKFLTKAAGVSTFHSDVMQMCTGTDCVKFNDAGKSELVQTSCSRQCLFICLGADKVGPFRDAVARLHDMSSELEPTAAMNRNEAQGFHQRPCGNRPHAQLPGLGAQFVK